jgi:hypothetical protein
MLFDIFLSPERVNSMRRQFNTTLLIAKILFNLSIFSGCGFQTQSNPLEVWDQKNDPLHFSDSYARKFADLPLSGTSAILPWSDTYWPSLFAGISVRWNGEMFSNLIDYPLITKDQIDQITPKKLAELSPAEKYDLYVGNFHYPLVRSERIRTGGVQPSWAGLCHGWAPASLNFKEPKSVLVTGKSGVQIPFGSSDIKALLSLVQGKPGSAPTKILGARCNKDLKNDPGSSSNPECKDVNAASFHLVLANELGLAKKGIIMDATRDLEVWNQPVFNYKAVVDAEQPASPGAATGTVKELIITNIITYGAESVALWNAVLGTEYFNSKTETYKYRLELDESGQILGGEWLSTERPDFLWVQEPAKFTGYFADLETIYQESLKSTGIPNPADQSPKEQAGSSAESNPEEPVVPFP